MLLLLRGCSFPERRDRDVDWNGLKWGVGMGRVQGHEKHGNGIRPNATLKGAGLQAHKICTSRAQTGTF